MYGELDFIIVSIIMYGELEDFDPILSDTLLCLPSLLKHLNSITPKIRN